MTRRVAGWQAALGRRGLEETNAYLEAKAEGLEVGKEVKLFLGEDYYVEFRRFREIVVRGGEAVELEVPAYIIGLTR